MPYVRKPLPKPPDNPDYFHRAGIRQRKCDRVPLVTGESQATKSIRATDGRISRSMAKVMLESIEADLAIIHLPNELSPNANLVLKDVREKISRLVIAVSQPIRDDKEPA